MSKHRKGDGTGDLFGEPSYDLYDGEPPAQRHSETSRDAATSIKKYIGALHLRIIAMLRARKSHGATDEEMQDQLDMLANTQRPRRRELQLMGYVHNSGAKRLTRSGREAVVWVLISGVAVSEDPQPAAAAQDHLGPRLVP